MCGTRWIPDQHLAVKLLESPENEDGYTSVHFAFPIPAGSRSLVLSPCPPFLVLLLHLLFLLRLFIPYPFASRRRLHPVERKKRDLRCAIAGVQQAMPVLLLSPLLLLLLSAGWLADGTDAADGASACHEERGA